MYQITNGEAFAGALTAQTTIKGKYLDVLGATIAIGAEGSNAIAVTIQLVDGFDNNLAERRSIRWYLSDDANGDSVAGTAPDGGIAIGTDGVLIPMIAGKAGWFTCEADGDIDIVITESAIDTWYLVLVMPDGRLVVSGAITFA